MSVLIKGMKMPETCDECEFHCYHSYGEYVCVAAPLLYPFNLANSKGIRKDWCPLVEIPEPHGRLIDADAYCEDLLEEAHRVWGLLKPETIERINRTVDDLKNYPAVVEAEGSENHDD